MDIEKLIESVRLCGSTPKVDQCKQCAYWSGGDMSKCIPRMTTDTATALSTLQAENESLKEKLYDGEGVNLVDYWMQQAKIEENGHRNCQAENEKLRAELERMKEIMRYNGIMVIPSKYPGGRSEWNIPKPRG